MNILQQSLKVETYNYPNSKIDIKIITILSFDVEGMKNLLSFVTVVP